MCGPSTNIQVTDPEPPDGGSGGLLLEDRH
jgi:hypothetical protein